jgi:hypothetical protein
MRSCGPSCPKARLSPVARLMPGRGDPAHYLCRRARRCWRVGVGVALGFGRRHRWELVRVGQSPDAFRGRAASRAAATRCLTSTAQVWTRASTRKAQAGSATTAGRGWALDAYAGVVACGGLSVRSAAFGERSRRMDCSSAWRSNNPGLKAWRPAAGAENPVTRARLGCRRHPCGRANCLLAWADERSVRVG